MAESTPNRDRDEQPSDRPLSGTPRWVKVFAVVALTLIVGFILLQVSGVGGEHGPGRHAPNGETGGARPPDATTVGHTGPPRGVTQP